MKRAIDLIDPHDLSLAAMQIGRFQGYRSEAVQMACALSGVSFADMSARRHERALVGRRWRVFWLLRQRGWSFPLIGQVCGGFDHTSVMYGVSRVEALVRSASVETERAAA